MNKQWCDLKKGIKAASRLHEQASEVEEPSSRFVTALEQLAESLQENQIHLDDLGYLLKFRKTKEGVAINVAVARTTTKTSVAVLQSMIDSAKSLRALMPKKPASEE